MTKMMINTTQLTTVSRVSRCRCPTPLAAIRFEFAIFPVIVASHILNDSAQW
jgi:hypothetical protein